jgi:protein-disulfide isomerase
MPSKNPSRTSAASRSLLVPGIALLAAIALGVAAFAGGGRTDTPEATETAQQNGQPTQEQADGLALIERRQEGDPLAVGDVDAPVLMIEWADFQCPFCGSFARDTKPVLMERYVDAGLLRIEWRDFPVLGAESRTAALAGRAAAEQDAFWELHDEIFAEDRDRNVGQLDEDSLIEMAANLGLDVERFVDSLEDPSHERAAQADLQLGQQLGITGTPAFLINGKMLIGGQPTEIFAQAIEQAADDAS